MLNTFFKTQRLKMLKPIMLSAFVVEIIILNVCTRLFYTVLKFTSFESLMKA